MTTLTLELDDDQATILLSAIAELANILDVWPGCKLAKIYTVRQVEEVATMVIGEMGANESLRLLSRLYQAAEDRGLTS